jgi:hypothetical protein
MRQHCRRAIQNRLFKFCGLLTMLWLPSCHRIARDAQAGSIDQPLSVCTVLGSPSLYRGKVLVVRGIYWLGLRDTCGEIRLGGRAWASALDLVQSGYLPSGQAPVAFKTDLNSLDTLDRLTIAEGRAGRREEIWTTLLGELRAPERYTRPDGSTVGGYGHLAVFPAELIIKRVLKTEIVSRPTYDYSEILHARAW